MTMTVGIYIKELEPSDEGKFVAVISDVARRHGYGVSFSLRSLAPEVRDGIESLKKAWPKSFFAFLHAPPGGLVADAWEIGVDLEPGRDRTRFAEFIKDLGSSMDGLTEYIWIAFMDHWGNNQKVRLLEGDTKYLIELLCRPCGWCQELYVPESDSYWCDDQIPLLYKIKI